MRLACSTRLLVLTSAIAAVAVGVTLYSPIYPSLPAAAVITFAAAVLLARFSSGSITWVLFGTAYLLSGLDTLFLRHPLAFPIAFLWPVGLAGLLASSGPFTVWSLPIQWRGPLIFWALVVATTWPIGALRELNFDPALWSHWEIANSPLFGAAPLMTAWIASTAATWLMGFLWLDWLFRTYPPNRLRHFYLYIVLPCLTSTAISSVAAIYQGTVDVGWASSTFWARLDRAAGLTADPNIIGPAAAIWIAGAVAWAICTRRKWATAFAVGSMVLGVVAVWMSGARMALAILVLEALLGLTFSLPIIPSSRRRWAMLGIACVVVVVPAIGVALPSGANPVGRTLALLPTVSRASVAALARELWNRSGYATAARQLIVDHPLVGVGPGSYQVMVTGKRIRGPSLDTVLEFDNAQSWYLQQLAELGLLGSVGWIAWTVAFATTLWQTRATDGTAGATAILKAIVVSLGVISVVAIRTQDPATMMIFWSFAFWIVRVSRPAISKITSPDGRSTLFRAVGFALIVLLVIGNSAVAREIRPPQRARCEGWPYSYGFYASEPGVGGQEFRWAARRAAAVVPAATRIAKISVWVNHRDAPLNPVHARVWHDGKLIIDTILRDPAPVTKYVSIDGPMMLMLETAVNRVLKPRDFGVADDRELGLAVSWQFVSRVSSSAP